MSKEATVSFELTEEHHFQKVVDLEWKLRDEHNLRMDTGCGYGMRDWELDDPDMTEEERELCIAEAEALGKREGINVIVDREPWDES